MRAEMIVQADVTAAIMGLKRIEDNMVQIARKQKLVNKEARGWGGRIKTAATHLATAYGTFKLISVTSNLITGSIRAWNEALDQSRIKLRSIQDATREYLAMQPAAGRMEEQRRLHAWAKESPLTIEEIGPIATNMLSMLPSDMPGIGPMERRRGEQAAEHFQLLQGLSGGSMASSIGKARRIFPGTTTTGWSNRFRRLTQKAGFAGPQLDEFMAQLAKGLAPAAIQKLDPDLVAGMLEVMSGPEGSASRATMGVGMVLQKVHKPGLARHLGIPQAQLAGMNTEQRLEALAGKQGGLDFMIAAMGEKAGSRAAFLLGGEGWSEVQRARGIYKGEAAKTHLTVVRDYQEALAADPVLRAEMTQRRVAEFPELRKVDPRYVKSATLQSRRVAWTKMMRAPGPWEWAFKGAMDATYALHYASSGGDEKYATGMLIEDVVSGIRLREGDAAADWAHDLWFETGRPGGLEIQAESRGPQVPKANARGAEMVITADPIE